MIIVSACLVGENCKYSGGNNKNSTVLQYLDGKSYITICPEVLGGLSTPRPPAEIIGEKVVTVNGIDVTNEFNLGAEKALKIATKNNCTLAILKSKSPSCGLNLIYDGSFTNTLIPGQGLTAEIFCQNNIKVIDELSLELK